MTKYMVESGYVWDEINDKAEVMIDLFNTRNDAIIAYQQALDESIDMLEEFWGWYDKEETTYTDHDHKLTEYYLNVDFETKPERITGLHITYYWVHMYPVTHKEQRSL